MSVCAKGSKNGPWGAGSFCNLSTLETLVVIVQPLRDVLLG